MVSFIFGGNTGLSYSDLQDRRKREEALAARILGQQPKTVAQGIGALLTGAGIGINKWRTDKGLNEGRQNATSQFDSLISKITGQPSPTSSGGSSIPMPEAAGEIAATSPSVNSSKNGSTFTPFIETVKAGGLTNPYGLAAVAATGEAESGWSPTNALRTWSDPSESGKPGTAGGILSWRGPRYKALSAAGDLSPEGQAKFFLQEDPNLIAALNGAKSVEEAQSIINRAWAFAGYDRPGGESARRLSLAKGYLPQFQGGNKVASLDPYAGMNTAAEAIETVAPTSGQPIAQPGEAAFDNGRWGDPIKLSEMPASPADLARRLQDQANSFVPSQGQAPSPTPSQTSAPPAFDNGRFGDPVSAFAPHSQPQASSQPRMPPTQQVAQVQQPLRPFNAGERRNNPDGSYSTELSTTWRLPDGSWTNVPSLWMGQNGPQQFNPDDEQGILGAMQAYESSTGNRFPRFGSQQEAEIAAQARSSAGGAGAQQPQMSQPDPQQQGFDPQILRLLSNPFLDEGQRSILQTVFQQQMQQQNQAREEQQWRARQDYAQQQRQSDPAYQLGLEQTRTEIERNKQPGYRMLSGDERKAYGIPEFDNRPYQISREGQVTAVGGAGQQQSPGVEASQREKLAAQYGIDPKSAEGQRYILTGTLPASDRGVTAGDREAIRDADDLVNSGEATLGLIDRAIALSDKAYEGAGAGTRALIASQWGDEGALATREFDNIVTEQALGQLKAIFGGAPTEGERAILLDVQGSSSQPKAVRDAILKRARAAVLRRVNFNRDRSNELRGGTYYKPRDANGQPPAPTAPAGPNVDDLLKKYGG